MTAATATPDDDPDLIGLENASRQARGKPPLTAQEIRGAEAAAGALLLHQVSDFLRRFIAYPSEHALDAHALWIAHTHLMDVWESTPRLAFLSPEPGSGKTRALEVTELLVPRPVEAVNATPAFLFRRISDAAGLPTILFDEIDTLFGAKAREHEEIRGVLNAGHRRGAVAGRCVVRGKVVETEELPAFCAVAVAGLGMLPDTLFSRSIDVRMRRRAPEEVVEPYRRRIHSAEGHALRDRLAAWCDLVRATLVGTWPEMPASIADRDADKWEPLLAVADAAGGGWQTRARVAAVALVADAKAATPSLGVRLLEDLRQVFGNADALRTDDILKALCALDEAPWGDLRGRPLDSRRLAHYLRPYGVRSKTVRIGTSTPRGYTREDLHDPWLRYLAKQANVADGKVEVGGSTPVIDGNVADRKSGGSTSSLPNSGYSAIDGDVGVARKGAATCATPATNSAAHCAHCTHFEANPGGSGAGWCFGFDTYTWPEPCPGCKKFEPVPETEA
jgi:hypothetical protein